MLQQTLHKLSLVRLAELPQSEFIVLDNNSTDNTRQVVQAFSGPPLRVRYLCETKRGVANCRNRALAVARGDAIAFLDDDMQPRDELWLEKICAPILSGKAHAVVGKTEIPQYLERSWMTPLHRLWLGCPEWRNPRDPEALITANMAFSPSILEQVPGFDPELGSGGRLGFWEDSLFSFQLKKVGYRLAATFDAVTEHHFDPKRLLRASFLDRARREGHSRAYVAHHWEHQDLKGVKRIVTRLAFRLACCRIARRKECMSQEGMPRWEMDIVEQLGYYRQYLREQKRPRAYSHYGLVKSTGMK